MLCTSCQQQHRLKPSLFMQSEEYQTTRRNSIRRFNDYRQRELRATNFMRITKQQYKNVRATGVVVHLEFLVAYAIFTVLHRRFGLVSSSPNDIQHTTKKNCIHVFSSVIAYHQGSAQEKRWPRFSECDQIDKGAAGAVNLREQRAHHSTRSLLRFSEALRKIH